MRIKITTAFTDKQAADPEDADRAVGDTITVSVERGRELVDLGLAVAADTSPPARKHREPRKRVPKPRIQPDAAEAAAPPPSPDTAPIPPEVASGASA